MKRISIAVRLKFSSITLDFRFEISHNFSVINIRLNLESFHSKASNLSQKNFLVKIVLLLLMNFLQKKSNLHGLFVTGL